MTTDPTHHTGHCLCGAVRYVIAGPLRGIIACHCSQCRRTSGHYVAMTSALRKNVEIAPCDSLTWYQSSATAERGFCNICGGNMFWRELQSDTISITAGTLDIPTGIVMEQHIFVADKSDYYTLVDDLPKHTAW